MLAATVRITIQIHCDLGFRRVVTGDRDTVLVLPELLDGQPSTCILHGVVLLLTAGYDHNLTLIQTIGLISALPSIISGFVAIHVCKDDIHSGFGLCTLW